MWMSGAKSKGFSIFCSFNLKLLLLNSQVFLNDFTPEPINLFSKKLL